MTMHASTIAELEKQERRIVLPRFDQSDAWRLGALLTERAIAVGAALLLDIRRLDLVLFRSALPGTSPDQQAWTERKAATVLRMEASSALIAARMKARSVDPVAIGWLDHRYALTGGSFPIRVSGVGVVGAVTASGLSSDDDHHFVVTGLTQLLTEMTARPSTTEHSSPPLTGPPSSIYRVGRTSVVETSPTRLAFQQRGLH